MKVSNKEYKRLCDIDDKMLTDKELTDKERQERLDIVTKMMKVEPKQ